MYKDQYLSIHPQKKKKKKKKHSIYVNLIVDIVRHWNLASVKWCLVNMPEVDHSGT